LCLLGRKFLVQNSRFKQLLVLAEVFVCKLGRFATGSPQPPPGGGLQLLTVDAARPLGCGLFASDQSRS